MTKRLLVLTSCIAIPALLGVFALHWQMGRMPDFYQHSLHQPAHETRSDVKKFLTQTATLISDVRHAETWQAVFTEKGINAWLTEEFPKLKHRFHLDNTPWITQPRVRLKNGEILIGGMQHSLLGKRVIWARIRLWLTQTARIAIQIRELRVGNMPLPEHRIFQFVAESARRTEFPLEWKQLDGHPVAIIDLRTKAPFENLLLLETGDHYISVSGSNDTLQP